MQEDEKKYEIKWQNRRLMAWLSFLSITIITFSLFFPQVLGLTPEYINAVAPLITNSLYVFVSIVLSYYGATAAINYNEIRNRK